MKAEKAGGRVLWAGCVPCLALAGACGADPPTRSETDAIVSVQDVDRDYSELRSYVLVETLDELCLQNDTEVTNPLQSGLGGAGSEDCTSIDHSMDSALIERIERNLKDLDFERLDRSQAEEADFVVNAGIVAKPLWDLAEPFCLANEFVDGCVEPLASQHLLVPSGSLVITWTITGGDDSYETAFSASIDQRWASGEALGSGELEAAGGDSGEGGTLSAWLYGIDVAHEQASYLEAKR